VGEIVSHRDSCEENFAAAAVRRLQLGVHILKYCRRKEEKKKQNKAGRARQTFIGAAVEWA
jgi:hypothetical protein